MIQLDIASGVLVQLINIPFFEVKFVLNLKQYNFKIVVLAISFECEIN